MRLDGKTAVVTGGGSGIGRATARRFAEEGATTVVIDIDADGGHETVETIDDGGGDATFREMDVTDHDQVEDVLTAVADSHGGVDVLYNNAGINRFATLEETTVADRDRMMDINVNGVWNCSRAVVPIMKAGDGGAIVNISSVFGYLGFATEIAYCMTKGATLNFTRALAHEVATDGIRVNAVCPGFVDTEMPARYFERQDDPEAARREAEEMHAMNRLGQPEEVANCVVFLASDEASFVTGEALTVDGGYAIS